MNDEQGKKVRNHNIWYILIMKITGNMADINASIVYSTNRW